MLSPCCSQYCFSDHSLFSVNVTRIYVCKSSLFTSLPGSESWKFSRHWFKFLSGLLPEYGKAADQRCTSLETSWDRGHHVDHSWLVKRLWGLSLSWFAMQETMGYNLASLVMSTVPGQKHICDSPSSKCLQTQSSLLCAIITQPHMPLPCIPLPSSGLVAMGVSWRQLSSASACLPLHLSLFIVSHL